MLLKNNASVRGLEDFLDERVLVVDLIRVVLRVDVEFVDVGGERAWTVDRSQGRDVDDAPRFRLREQPLGAGLGALKYAGPSTLVVDVLIHLLVVEVDVLRVHVLVEPVPDLLEGRVLHPLPAGEDETDAPFDDPEGLEPQ